MAGRDHRKLPHHTCGAAEDVAPLLGPEHADICGVLGSSADAANVPNPLGDDFVLMPHAAAPTPYPSAFIKRGAEVLLHADGDERWTVENIDHGAHERRGPERVVAELGSETIEGEWAVEGRTLSVRVGEATLRYTVAGGDDAAAIARAIVVEIVRAERSRSPRPIMKWLALRCPVARRMMSIWYYIFTGPSRKLSVASSQSLSLSRSPRPDRGLVVGPTT